LLFHCPLLECPSLIEKREVAMLKKSKSQKRKTSPDTLLKTSKKKDIELTEKELGKVSGGTEKVRIHFTATTKDKVSPLLAI
jgi:hypothetical protein